MLRFYRVWMGVLTVLFVIQVFLAGYGALGAGAPAEAYEFHILNGRLIAAVALLAILWAALARAGGRLVALTAGVFGLVLLQSVIAMVSVDGTVVGQAIFGLHAVNAFVIMMVAERADRTARRAGGAAAAAAERGREPAAAT